MRELSYPNHSFLNKIDTEEKAYFLGFFFADGYNQVKMPKNAASKVRIQLQERDRYILDLFASWIFPTPKKLYFQKSRNPNQQNKFSLEISSNMMSQDLVKYGAIQKKSLVLDFPPENSIPDSLMHHFIRGYVDGDGCIIKCKMPKDTHTPSFKVKICGTPAFIMGVHKIVNSLGVSSVIERDPKRKIAVLQIIGNKNCRQFLPWLYKDSTAFLARKYEKYLELQDTENQILSKKCVFELNGQKYNTKMFLELIKAKGDWILYERLKKGLTYKDIYEEFCS